MNRNASNPAHCTGPGRLARALVAAWLAGLSACGGGGGDDAGGGTPPPQALGAPVSATVGAAGGELAFTASGVAGRLAFPAGSLASDATITVTPVAPAEGEWARVDVSGLSGVLEQPAMLTLTLPAGSTLDPAAGVTQAGSEGDSMLPATLDSASRTVTVAVQRFGSAGEVKAALAAGRGARPLAAGANPGALILNQRLLVQLRVINAEARLRQLQRIGDFSATLELSMSIAALLQSSGLDGYEAQARPWLDRAGASACEELRLAIERALSTPAPAELDLQGRIANAYVTRMSAPVVYWANVAAKLGVSCAGLDPQVAIRQAHERLLALVAATLRARQDIASLKGAVGEAAAAKALSQQGAALSAVGHAAPQQGGPAAVLGAQIRSEVMVPTLEPLRAAHWRAGSVEATQDAYRHSLAVYGGASPLADDLQLVGTTLQVGSYGDLAATQEEGRSTLGRQATPQASVRSATVAARAGGTVHVEGPIQVLKCPAAADERLVVTFEGTEVLSRPSSGDLLLQGRLEFEVDRLLGAAGIQAGNATQHVLRVWRKASGCNAVFGVGDAVVADVTLDFKAARLGAFAATTTRNDPSFQVMAPGAQGRLLLYSRSGAGFAPGLPSPPGHYIASLNPQLQAEWVAEWSLPGEFNANAMATDPAGHLVVVGTNLPAGSAGNYQVVVASFDKNNGQRRWLVTFDSTPNPDAGDPHDFAGPGLAFDATGNIYFGMRAEARFGEKQAYGREPMLVKLDANGVLQWAKPMEGFSASGASMQVVAAAPNGEVVIAWERDKPAVAGESEIAVRRYSPEGQVVRTDLVDQPGYDRLRTLAVSSTGDVLLSSRVDREDPPNGTVYNCYVTRLDASGNLRARVEFARSVWQAAFDGAGRAIVVSQETACAGDLGPLELSAYDADGTRLWSRALGDGGAVALAVDSTGVASLSYLTPTGGGLLGAGALLRFRTDTGP